MTVSVPGSSLPWPAKALILCFLCLFQITKMIISYRTQKESRQRLSFPTCQSEGLVLCIGGNILDNFNADQNRKASLCPTWPAKGLALRLVCLGFCQPGCSLLLCPRPPVRGSNFIQTHHTLSSRTLSMTERALEAG